MATLTAVTTLPTGVTFAPTAAAVGGDQFLNNGNERFYIKNASGGSITVTFAPAGTPGGLALATYTVTVGAGVEKFVGPFSPQYFNNSSGYVTVTYSAVTSVTVAVIN